MFTCLKLINGFTVGKGQRISIWCKATSREQTQQKCKGRNPPSPAIFSLAGTRLLDNKSNDGNCLLVRILSRLCQWRANGIQKLSESINWSVGRRGPPATIQWPNVAKYNRREADSLTITSLHPFAYQINGTGSITLKERKWVAMDITSSGRMSLFGAEWSYKAKAVQATAGAQGQGKWYQSSGIRQIRQSIVVKFEVEWQRRWLNLTVYKIFWNLSKAAIARLHRNNS